jgi:hypothetical protein
LPVAAAAEFKRRRRLAPPNWLPSFLQQWGLLDIAGGDRGKAQGTKQVTPKNGSFVFSLCSFFSAARRLGKKHGARLRFCLRRSYGKEKKSDKQKNEIFTAAC